RRARAGRSGGSSRRGRDGVEGVGLVGGGGRGDRGVRSESGTLSGGGSSGRGGHIDGLDVSHSAVDGGGDNSLGGTSAQGVGESDILGRGDSLVVSRNSVGRSNSRGGDGGAAVDTGAERNGHGSNTGRRSANGTGTGSRAGTSRVDKSRAGNNGRAGLGRSRVDGHNRGRHRLVAVATGVEVHLASLEAVVVGLTDGGESTQQGNGNLGSKLHGERLW
ncbi:hypothetical protein ASPCADRAFT_128019, partial [Aspergillus carbonarius ITEM 5010]